MPFLACGEGDAGLTNQVLVWHVILTLREDMVQCHEIGNNPAENSKKRCVIWIIYYRDVLLAECDPMFSTTIIRSKAPC